MWLRGLFDCQTVGHDPASRRPSKTCEAKVESVWYALRFRAAQRFDRNPIKRYPMGHDRISILGTCAPEQRVSFARCWARPGCPRNLKHAFRMSARHQEAVE